MISSLSGHKPMAVPACKAPAVDGTLTVNDASFAKITLSDLQPGDIGFQVQRTRRDFKQFWITVGGHISRHIRHDRPTDPFVVHAFVVIKPHPKKMVLHSVDGAADNYTGINHLRMNFGANKFRVVPGGRYVFFRPNDADMGQRIVNVADNWAKPDQHNFSITRAVASPFHSLRFDKKARAQAKLLASQADVKAPPKRQNGKIFKMSCSELVFNVLSAAASTRWRYEHPQAHDTLGANLQGPFGKELAIDAKGASPPTLEAILQNSHHWSKVGYLTDNG